MDDSEFKDGLESKEERDAEWYDAAEALIRLKRPPLETEKQASIWTELMHHDPSGTIASLRSAEALPFLAAGAMLGAGLQAYGNTKSKADPTMSKAEYAAHNIVRGQKPEDASTGLTAKTMHRTNELVLGLAKAYKEHPVKSTILSGLLGAGAGVTASHMINAGKHLLTKKR